MIEPVWLRRAASGCVLIFGLFIGDALAGSPPGADEHTVGLWLFDEPNYPYTTLTEASVYRYDLYLMEGGSMVPGRFGGALRVGSGSGYAVAYAGFAGKVPEEELREKDGTPSGLWGPTEGPGKLLEGLAGNRWTVEMWLNLTAVGGKATILDLGQAYRPGFSLSVKGGAFTIVNSYAGLRATCPTTLESGRWNHVTFTCSNGKIRHFLGGKEQKGCATQPFPREPLPDLQKPEDREHGDRGFGKMGAEERRRNRFNVAVGTDRRGGRAVSGMIDELRISDLVRYTGRFTPASFSRNYGKNAPGPAKANGPPLLFSRDASTGPIVLGGRKHVFIDDALLEKKTGLHIVLNKPYGKQKLALDFEIRKSAWRPSVFDVDGIVHLAIPEGYSSETGMTWLALSADGLAFSKRSQPIIKDTPLYGGFFEDLNPAAGPEERYKLSAFVGNRGMYLYVSPDGKRWRRNETIQLPLRSGGGGECFWDDQRGRYACFLKRDSSFHSDEAPRVGGRTAVGFWTADALKPWPFRHMKMPYFEGYPFPAVTGEGPVSFGVMPAGQVYRTRAIKYPWAPDVYLAFVWRYPGDDGPRHVELAVSRDGERWTFFGQNWYIPRGGAEEELSMYGLIRRGDEIWQYVNEGGAHGGDAPRTYYRYKQRLDGFTSLDAPGAGSAATRPLIFAGRKLVVNVAAKGFLRVGIADKDGRPIPGFSIEDCAPIRADSVRHKVKWKDGADVSRLAGGTVRLLFEMNEAKLYALQFTN